MGIFIALIIHAVIFGMLHIYQGLAGVIATGCIALIFGSVYFIIKRKLFPIILVSLFKNDKLHTKVYGQR